MLYKGPHLRVCSSDDFIYCIAMDIPQVISAISAVFIMATFAQSCVLGGSLKDRVGQAHLKQNGYLSNELNAYWNMQLRHETFKNPIFFNTFLQCKSEHENSDIQGPKFVSLVCPILFVIVTPL